MSRAAGVGENGSVQFSWVEGMKSTKSVKEYEGGDLCYYYRGSS